MSTMLSKLFSIRLLSVCCMIDLFLRLFISPHLNAVVALDPTHGPPFYQRCRCISNAGSINGLSPLHSWLVYPFGQCSLIRISAGSIASPDIIA